MNSFYKPKIINFNERPIIIYPCSGIEKIFDRQEKESLENHIREVFAKNQELLNTGEYYIVILWDEKGDKMSDVWIFGQLESWGSGPLVDVKIFRNLNLETTIGVSAGDGLIMLGREEEHRRKSKSFYEYIHDPRPELPSGINPEEEFYL